MATGLALANAWYHDRLDPAWVRPDRAATQALFERLGMTGEFWGL